MTRSRRDVDQRAPGARVRRGLLRRSGRDDEEDATDLLASTAEALAVLLDAGLAPSSAWRHVGAASRLSEIRRVATRIEGGEPVEDALVAEATRTGRERHGEGAGSPANDGGLSALAAAWVVAASAGSPLSPALRAAATALRDRADVAREVDVALSGPRSTARLVGWLPLVGVGLSLLLGIDVFGALTGTPVGIALLVAGVGMALWGRTWTAALVRRATPRGDVPGTEEELIVIALRSGLSIDHSRRLVADAESRLGLDASDGRDVDGVLKLAERAGAPAAELLASAAAQRRRVARAAGRRRASDLGVQLVLPLAVCILPSFLLLGVAPVVLGLISSTIAGF